MKHSPTLRIKKNLLTKQMFLTFLIASLWAFPTIASPQDSQMTRIPLPEGFQSKLNSKILKAQITILDRYAVDDDFSFLTDQFDSELKKSNQKSEDIDLSNSSTKEKLKTVHIPLLEQNPFEKVLPPFVHKLEDHGLSHIFALDLGYDFLNFTNTGFAIGANFEQKFFSYASLKTGLNIKRDRIPDSNLTISSIGLNLTGLVYPFGKGLEWLYLGCGIGTDFQTYSGSGKLPSPAEDIVVSVIPTIGWKQMLWKMVMIDVGFGYKKIVQNSNRYADNADYVKSGIQYGVKFQIMWSRLIKTILHKDIGVDNLGKPLIKKNKKSKKGKNHSNRVSSQK